MGTTPHTPPYGQLQTAATRLWPNLRYLGLGILITWLYLLVDSGIWRSESEASGDVTFIATTYFYGAMLGVFVLAALNRPLARRLLDARIFPLGLGIITTAAVTAVIITGPTFATSGLIWLFGPANIGCGAAMALLVLQYGRIYCQLPSEKVLYFSLVSQMVGFVIFSIAIAYDDWTVTVGGPSISGIVALYGLPIAAALCARIGVQSAPDNQVGNSAAQVPPHPPQRPRRS